MISTTYEFFFIKILSHSAIALQDKAFKIQSSTYQRCLVYQNPPTNSRIPEPSLTLKNCDQNKTEHAQLWMWTKNRKLRLKDAHGCHCLTATSRGLVHLMKCSKKFKHLQKWECRGNLLKLKNKNSYLVPFNFSPSTINLFGIIMRTVPTKQQFGLTVYGGGKWTQQGREMSLCSKTFA